MKKRFLSLALALALCLGLSIAGASAAGFTRSRTYSGQFADVPANTWYSQVVKDCYELGLINGTSDTTFSPAGLFTLAEASSIAARMHSIYHGGSGVIPGSGGKWYQGAVDYCIQNGIYGRNDFSDYTRPATRAQMAGIIAAALPDSAWTAKNHVTALPDVSGGTKYSDAIFALYDAGVFAGSDEYGAFQPYAYITRAEVAAIVARCADPSQRVTLNLTPMSQREVPVIPNFSSSRNGLNDSKVSDGLLRVQDSNTKLYGYMDWTGALVIPYQFSSASDFSNGCATVAVGSGNSASYGAINTKGEQIVPFKYKSTDFNGIFIIANDNYGGCDFFSPLGEPYGHFSYEFSSNERGSLSFYCTNSPLLAVHQGSKWAVGSPDGELITEAIYDNVNLHENSSFALLRYGSQYGLASLNGIVFTPGEYKGFGSLYYGDYIGVYDGENSALADANGILSKFIPGSFHLSTIIASDNIILAEDANYFRFIMYEISTGQTYSSADGISRAIKSQGAGHVELADGRCMLFDGTWCQNEEKLDAKIWNSYDSYYHVFTGPDGKYGLCVDGSVLAEAIYNTPDAAIAAYGYYRIDKENGKPIVAYGNEVVGFSPVIHYYRNNIYYDQILDIGEGYYACRYDTTWYLVHP